MQDPAERALLEPEEDESHDISLGTFRFVAMLLAAGLVLMIAGAL